TLWTVLSLVVKGAYHFSPLDAQILAKLCREQHGTIIMSTPTFLRSYTKRCNAADLQSLEVVITGAEKLPAAVAERFEQKFGARPYEGYGATETSPVAAVNIPPNRAKETGRPLDRAGTVGRPLPQVQAKIVDPESFADLPIGAPGMLLIKGPNVMQGYLNKPEQTAQVIRDGWYITGDIAKLDSDGFIQITDRASRFSKIGGEMVPHIKVEEALQKILSAGADDEGELKVAVTAIPDERKGERLIVVHRQRDLSVERTCKQLAESGLPNLFIPGSDSFLYVEEIPHLGTGKVDLKGLKQLALAHFSITAD
ncbi:MAG TPA: AMP-binding protein, partial [Pirellulales bacterium]|nr:AMP-binding protein [Pirellulales bacterium]